MNPRYIHVFRSHRVLFLLPVVLAGAVALWVAATAPTMYQSRATLWSDTVVGASDSRSPAESDQQLLNELLSTRYFQGVVAHRSPLAAYLETHSARGLGPSALLGRLRSSPSLDEQIAEALGPKRVVTTLHGPHVLEVTFAAPAPELASDALGVIVRQFIEQRDAFRQDALAAAETKLAEASKALSAARKDLERYLDAHPSAERDDAQLKELATTERLAVLTLTNASEGIDRAAAMMSSETVVRIVDAPSVPPGPTTGKGRIVLALLAGLFAGGIVSVLGVVAVARAGTAGVAAARGEPDVRPPQSGDSSQDGTAPAAPAGGGPEAPAQPDRMPAHKGEPSSPRGAPGAVTRGSTRRGSVPAASRRDRRRRR